VYIDTMETKLFTLSLILLLIGLVSAFIIVPMAIIALISGAGLLSFTACSYIEKHYA
jgi:hypothetical protein